MPTDVKTRDEIADRVEQQNTERNTTPTSATSRSFNADATNNDGTKEITTYEKETSTPVNGDDNKKLRTHYPSILMAKEPTQLKKYTKQNLIENIKLIHHPSIAVSCEPTLPKRRKHTQRAA